MKIQGADDLQKKLARLSSEAIGSALALAAKAGAEKIILSAKQKVPVRSGTLKRSIQSKIMSQTDTSIEIAIGPNTPYAARIEFGYDGKTKRRTKAGHVVYVHQKAKPYLRPAFDEQVDTARDTIKARFKTLIDKAAQ